MPGRICRYTQRGNRTFGGFVFMITASESHQNTRSRYLASLNGCILPRSTPEQELASLFANDWYFDTVEPFGLSQKEKGEDPDSASQYPEQNLDPLREPSRALNIVLVEDNTTDAFLVQEALDYHGIQATITCHEDGEEMLLYIDKIDAGTIPCPDVVLLDLNLPRHSGKAVLARMRKSPICGHVPVVIVTSSRAPEDQADARRLGATRYFYKSIDYDEAMTLGRVVLEVTRREDAN